MEKKATKKAAPVKKAAAKKVTTKEPAKKVPAKKPVRATEPAKPAVKKPRKKVEAEPVAQKPVVQPEKKAVEVKKVTAPAPVVEVVKPAPVVEPVNTAPAHTPKPVVTPVAPKPAHKRATPRTGTALIAHGVGRRKCAVARVWLRLGSGKLMVNEREYARYFPTEIARLAVVRPFKTIAHAQHYDVMANVQGGGSGAQAEAVSLGFARALLQLNESWRSDLRKAGLLTVDSRQKERKKYGQKRARRKFQFVKR